MAPALASIADAVEAAGETGHRVTGTIRLSVPRSAAELVLLPLVLDDIGSSALVRVLEDWCEPFSGFFLYYPSRKLMRPVMRAFIDNISSLLR